MSVLRTPTSLPNSTSTNFGHQAFISSCHALPFSPSRVHAAVVLLIYVSVSVYDASHQHGVSSPLPA